MNIELLVIPDCPHAAAAEALVRAALREAGSPDLVHRRLIQTRADAERQGFIGSPTILIDGVDPFAEPGRPPALACRIYPGTGGLPPADRLRQALGLGGGE